MWCIFVCIFFFLTNLSSSIPVIINSEFYQSRTLEVIHDNLNISSNICFIRPINIDELTNDTSIQHKDSTTTTTNIDITQFTSSYQHEVVTDDNGSILFNIILVTFTIPYKISNESILNKTVFITDILHNKLLAILTDICYNESSFFINYSTIQSLPQNVCLYLLLNLTLSMNLRELIICRTIENSSNYSSSLSDTTSHSVGPSEFFILSQCIIIVIMMFIIYGVQTAREKNLVNNVSERLVRTRPYIILFGNKTTVRTDSHVSVSPATTLQAGLNQLNLHRRLTTLPNHQMVKPIEEQVLAANDLTSTLNDRRTSGLFVNRDFLDVKEFTKRISAPNESSTDVDIDSL